MSRTVALLVLLAGSAAPAVPRAPLKVLVWDEQQKEQQQVYPNFLGNHLADHLKKQEGLEVRSAAFGDPDQGLTDENVDWADVVVWWGHQKHGQVADKPVARIIERVKAGKCGLVPVHSAHYSKVFKSAMFERQKQDLLAKIPEVERGRVEFVKQPKLGKPAEVSREEKDGKIVITVVAPECGLGGWRSDGLPSHVETKAPDHPIAKGLPARFDIPKTEMYNEDFKVPEPDTVVFFETWDKGEKFRAGCCWQLGQGRVFYFRPGHETFPVFHQAETLKVIHNAVLWAGKRA